MSTNCLALEFGDTEGLKRTLMMLHQKEYGIWGTFNKISADNGACINQIKLCMTYEQIDELISALTLFRGKKRRFPDFFARLNLPLNDSFTLVQRYGFSGLYNLYFYSWQRIGDHDTGILFRKLVNDVEYGNKLVAQIINNSFIEEQNNELLDLRIKEFLKS